MLSGKSPGCMMILLSAANACHCREFLAPQLSFVGDQQDGTVRAQKERWTKTSIETCTWAEAPSDEGRPSKSRVLFSVPGFAHDHPRSCVIHAAWPTSPSSLEMVDTLPGVTSEKVAQ